MKDVIKFILFLIYTVSIFFLDNYILIGLCAILNILMLIILKINLVKAVKNLLGISILSIIVVAINSILAGIAEGILIGIKLLLVCNATYTFSKMLSPVALANVIEKLLFPLKIFKVNPQDIGLMITIAISFLPILIKTFEQTIFAIKAKGMKAKITNSKIVLKPIFISTLKRVNEIELSLKAKGYEG